MRSDSNGQPARRARAKSPPARNAHDDGELLKEAVANPGTLEVPEQVAPAAKTVAEIPEASFDPARNAGGKRLDADTATMTPPLDRVRPHGWNQVFPERTLKTVLLPWREQRDDAPTYHYVIPELQGPLKRWLREVRVYLMFDTCGEGQAFLWIVLASANSPYFVAMNQVEAKGPKFLRENLFQFEFRQDSRRVAVSFRPRDPDDPGAVLPSRPVGKLLPEALGPERIITDPAHPVYVKVTAGSRLS
jgi:hypothetical protein